MRSHRVDREPVQLLATRHAAQVTRLVGEGAPDERRVSERQLHGDDAARAAREDDHVRKAEAAQQRGSVIRVLRGPAPGPALPTAPQRPASVVGHDRMPSEALGDWPPALRVLGATRDQQHRRPGAAELDVQGCPVDRLASDLRCGRHGVRVGVGSQIGLHHTAESTDEPSTGASAWAPQGAGVAR